MLRMCPGPYAINFFSTRELIPFQHTACFLLCAILKALGISFMLEHDKFLFRKQGPSSRDDSISWPDSCSLPSACIDVPPQRACPCYVILRPGSVCSWWLPFCIPSSQSAFAPQRPDSTQFSIPLCAYSGQKVLSKGSEHRNLWQLFTLYIPGYVRPVLTLTCIYFSGKPIFLSVFNKYVHRTYHVPT